MNKQKQAFTLVELVVVIIILAILGTIAFISLQWYGANARDSVRVSDLSNIRTSLDLFQLDAWKYPLPTEHFEVTHSWSEVWKQGIFWESTFTNIKKLDKIPVDPLTEKPYAYSILNTKQSYQLGWIIESELTVFSPVISNNSFAEDKTLASALVVWNYGWIMTKTVSGSLCNVLAVPSIISSLDNSITDLNDIASASWFVYNGFNNLPSNYKSSKFNVKWWFNFKPQTLIAYQEEDFWEIGETSWWTCASLYDSEYNGTRIELINNLKNIYSNSDLSWKAEFRSIMESNTNDAKSMVYLWVDYINNNLSWTITRKWFSVPSNCDNQPNIQNASFTEWNPTQPFTQWQNTDSNAACYYECINWFTWDTCGSDPSFLSGSQIPINLWVHNGMASFVNSNGQLVLVNNTRRHPNPPYLPWLVISDTISWDFTFSFTTTGWWTKHGFMWIIPLSPTNQNLLPSGKLSLAEQSSYEDCWNWHAIWTNLRRRYTWWYGRTRWDSSPTLVMYRRWNQVWSCNDWYCSWKMNVSWDIKFWIFYSSWPCRTYSNIQHPVTSMSFSQP